MTKQQLPGGAHRVYLTSAELAAETGLSIRYFQKLAKRVPFATQPEPGGPILFDRAGWDAWLEAGRTKTATRAKWKPQPRVRRTAPDGEAPLIQKLREMRRELTKVKR